MADTFHLPDTSSDKPESRSGGDSDLDNDLEYDLLKDGDAIVDKKNLSDMSEELNDDILQTDDDDDNKSECFSNLDATFDASSCLLSSVENRRDLGDPKAFFSRDIYPVGELHFEIHHPTVTEFQQKKDNCYGNREVVTDDHKKADKAEMDVEDFTLTRSAEDREKEAGPLDNTKEESDEEEDEDREQRCRLRFRSERRSSSLSCMSAAGNRKRKIPETLELSEDTKRALDECQKKRCRRGKYGQFTRRDRGRRGEMQNTVDGEQTSEALPHFVPTLPGMQRCPSKVSPALGVPHTPCSWRMFSEPHNTFFGHDHSVEQSPSLLPSGSHNPTPQQEAGGFSSAPKEVVRLGQHSSTDCKLVKAPFLQQDLPAKSTQKIWTPVLLRPAPAAQVRPITRAPPATPVVSRETGQVRCKKIFEQGDSQKATEEDARLYQLKLEEQKRCREEVLRRKEQRRQQQAEARRRELKERLAHQQGDMTPSLWQDVQSQANRPQLLHKRGSFRPTPQNFLQRALPTADRWCERAHSAPFRRSGAPKALRRNRVTPGCQAQYYRHTWKRNMFQSSVCEEEKVHQMQSRVRVVQLLNEGISAAEGGEANGMMESGSRLRVSISH